MPGTDLTKTPVSVDNIVNGLLPEIDGRIDKKLGWSGEGGILDIKMSKRVLNEESISDGFFAGEKVEMETTVRLIRNTVEETKVQLIEKLEKFVVGEGYSINEQGEAVIPGTPQNVNVVVKSEITIPTEISGLGKIYNCESVVMGNPMLGYASVEVRASKCTPENASLISTTDWQKLANLAAKKPELFTEWTKETTRFTINYSGVGKVPMQIVALNQYDLANGNGKCGFVMMPMCVPFNHKMNETAKTTDGFSGSYMHAQESTIMSKYLPSEWRNIIKEVQIPYTKTETSEAEMMSAKLFPASEMEVFGVSASSRKPAGTQFPYWAEHNTNEDRILKTNLGNGTAQWWWLRDVYSSTVFVGVSTTGAVSSNGASNEDGAPLCFCIGSSE